MAERARIARFFAPLTAGETGAYSLTDDAALLTPPHPIVVTTDSVIAGIHVLADASPEQIATKLMCRNLSDLAAMGATPWRYFLNLHTPALPENWFAAFAATLAREQTRFGLVLAGGDSTAGDKVVHATMTCIGLAEHGILLRSKAQVGDDVYVSGTIGDAALGLQLLQQTLATDSAATAHLTQRYHSPEPRLTLGTALHGIATAVIDVSDGLLADAAQLAEASQVGIALQRALIPLSDAARAVTHADTARWQTVLTGGDDYELLFTAPAPLREQIATTLAVTRIGMVTEGSGVLLDGTPAHGGFEHR